MDARGDFLCLAPGELSVNHSFTVEVFMFPKFFAPIPRGAHAASASKYTNGTVLLVVAEMWGAIRFCDISDTSS